MCDAANVYIYIHWLIYKWLKISEQFIFKTVPACTRTVPSFIYIYTRVLLWLSSYLRVQEHYLRIFTLHACISVISGFTWVPVCTRIYYRHVQYTATACTFVLKYTHVPSLVHVHAFKVHAHAKKCWVSHKLYCICHCHNSSV